MPPYRAAAWMVIVVGYLAAAATAAVPGFVRGAVYWGATSQKTKIRIQVATTGRTAAVDAGIVARCP